MVWNKYKIFKLENPQHGLKYAMSAHDGIYEFENVPAAILRIKLLNPSPFVEIAMTAEVLEDYKSDVEVAVLAIDDPDF